MHLPLRRASCLLASACSLVGLSASAAQFNYIRIGDIDGFGYNPAGLVRATSPTHTTPADTNANGLLEQTEYLPDLNKNGTVATGSGDDFDHRSVAEIGNGSLQSLGVATSAGTLGSKWTDIALSTSMPDAGFPDGNSAAPNEPVFNFRFTVNKTDLASGTPLFFNLIFGDYDVSPASVKITKNNGAGAAGANTTINLTTQSGSNDGLIQAAFLNLAFGDVFSDGGSVWTGYLDVAFDANNEPYTAFDYVELSSQQVSLTPVPDAGSSLLLLGLGALALRAVRGRQS